MQVSVELNQNGEYFAGEKLSARIKIQGQKLLFGSVQIYGTIKNDPYFVKLNMEKLSLPDLSLAANEYPFFVSQNTLLFTEILSEEYIFNILLPIELPSSYSGIGIRVSYFFVLRLQPQNLSSCVVLKKSFKIHCALNDDATISSFDLNPIILGPKSSGKSKVVGVSKDLIVEISSKISKKQKITFCSDFVEKWNQKICDIICNSPTKIFTIQNDSKKVANICLPRTVFKVGDVIYGIIDFESSEMHSVNICVFLEYFEQEDEKCSVQPNGELKRISTRIISSTQSSVHNTKTFAFDLIIPSSCPPCLGLLGFQLKYQIRIEFTLKSLDSSMFRMESGDEHQAILVLKDNAECLKFSCELPLSVIPQQIPQTKRCFSWKIPVY